MVTITAATAGILRLHLRQFILQETINNILDILKCFLVSIKHLDADLIKPLHRSHPHPANHNNIDIMILEVIHRHHAAASSMLNIANSAYLCNCTVFKINNSKDIRLTKMP